MARSSRLESGFQDRLIKTLKNRFPGCMVFKMDQLQGIPDLLVLYEDKWASLECKKDAGAKRQFVMALLRRNGGLLSQPWKNSSCSTVFAERWKKCSGKGCIHTVTPAFPVEEPIRQRRS